MARCPNCGSTAQPKLLATEYNEDGWSIEVVRYYICGCGETFRIIKLNKSLCYAVNGGAFRYVND